MQTIFCSLFILIAALYVAGQWLPHKVKLRIMRLCGMTAPTQPIGLCSSCSSCGGCEKNGEGNNNKTVEKSFQKVIMTYSK